MPRRHTPIVDDQDRALSVLPEKDEHGRVGVYVRIGEDGMGYNVSSRATFHLTKSEAAKMIKHLQQAISG